MTNAIESAVLNIGNGVMDGTMQFRPGLNLVSGENGTFKTRLLQALGGGGAPVTYHNTEPPPRIQSINPRRNSQRRDEQAIYNEIRQQDKRLATLIAAKSMNDASFEPYPSVGDLFFTVYEDRCKDGGNRRAHMTETVMEFNKVIGRIFEHYSLQAEWDEERGAPKIEMRKHGITTVPLAGLSLGEQEILSLVTYITSSRDAYDVFLIDEPEVHLNWHLEEKLFIFLDEFCADYAKQMIVVTHSRVVFTPRFLPVTTFLYWADRQVRWGSELSADQRRRIAGEAIEMMKVGAFSKPTFFVEDEAQARIVREIADALAVDVLTSVCGGKSNVRSLFRFAGMEGWTNCYFVEDGDNEGPPSTSRTFIHLDRYCIESYLFNPAIAASVSGKSEAAARQALFEAILERKDHIFAKGKNKFFAFLIDQFTVDHVTEERIALLDGSEVFTAFVAKLGIPAINYVRKYIRAAESNGQLEVVLPERLVTAIRKEAMRIDDSVRSVGA